MDASTVGQAFMAAVGALIVVLMVREAVRKPATAERPAADRHQDE